MASCETRFPEPDALARARMSEIVVGDQPQSPSAAPSPGDPGRFASDAVILVRDLSKRFNLYKDPWDRITEWITWGRAVRHETFWALQDVGFEMDRRMLTSTAPQDRLLLRRLA